MLCSSVTAICPARRVLRLDDLLDLRSPLLLHGSWPRAGHLSFHTPLVVNRKDMEKSRTAGRVVMDAVTHVLLAFWRAHVMQASLTQSGPASGSRAPAPHALLVHWLHTCTVFHCRDLQGRCDVAPHGSSRTCATDNFPICPHAIACA